MLLIHYYHYYGYSLGFAMNLDHLRFARFGVLWQTQFVKHPKHPLTTFHDTLVNDIVKLINAHRIIKNVTTITTKCNLKLSQIITVNIIITLPALQIVTKLLLLKVFL